MKALTWETKRFDLADERELIYNVVGAGMPVLLLNGLGGSREIWAELVEHLQDRYRFITFDYSGLRGGMSGPAQAHTVSLHARDAQAILQRESVARCAARRSGMECSAVCCRHSGATHEVPGHVRHVLERLILRDL